MYHSSSSSLISNAEILSLHFLLLNLPHTWEETISCNKPENSDLPENKTVKHFLYYFCNIFIIALPTGKRAKSLRGNTNLGVGWRDDIVLKFQNIQKKFCRLFSILKTLSSTQELRKQHLGNR